MLLQHAADISHAYAIGAGGAATAGVPKDVVITVPSFATDTERRSVQLAAQIAGMNVLSLIDETVAAALQFAMDKDFAEAEQTVLFYNMGAASTQVVICHFFNYDAPQKFGKSKSTPAFTVLSKAWDATVGGLAFDHRLTEYLADQLNTKLKYDVRTNTRAMTKLRLEANKIKHVLSANTERPVSLDHDGVHVSFTITRSQFEDMCADLIAAAIAPVTTALTHANITDFAPETNTTVQVLGGGLRIPAVQTQLDAVGVPVQKNMNTDEAMALGAAFYGANLSTAFRVRSIGMTDTSPWAIGIQMEDLVPADDETEVWSKEATIFKAWGKVGVKKTIAFTHDQDVHAGLRYVDTKDEPLEKYNVSGIAEFAKEMEAIGKPKVSLQFELSSSGITSLVKAEAAVEETYTVQEEVEIDVEDDGEAENVTADGEADASKDDADTDAKTDTDPKKEDGDEKDATDTDSAEAADGEAKNDTKEEEAPKKKKKKITVEKVRNDTACRFSLRHGLIDSQSFFGLRRNPPAFVAPQEKKKVHKKTLTVERYFVGDVRPLSTTLLAEAKAKLAEMDATDKQRILLESARNKYESYIYKVKNQLVDNIEAIEAVTNEKQRKEVSKLASEAETWLDDEGYKADLATTEDKYAELSAPFEKIVLRMDESIARPETMERLRKSLTDVEAMVATWVDEKPQITEEERAEVLKQVEEVRKWADEKEKKQSKKKPHEDPAFLSSDIPPQVLPIRQKVKFLNKRPKPKPKVEKKKANSTATNATDANATDAEEDATATEDSKAEATDDSKEESAGGESSKDSDASPNLDGGDATKEDVADEL